MAAGFFGAEPSGFGAAGRGKIEVHAEPVVAEVTFDKAGASAEDEPGSQVWMLDEIPQQQVKAYVLFEERSVLHPRVGGEHGDEFLHWASSKRRRSPTGYRRAYFAIVLGLTRSRYSRHSPAGAWPFRTRHRSR